MDAGVAAVAAVWRHQVRRIAGEKDAAFAESARDVGRRAPSRDAGDRHRQIGDARRMPHVRDERLLTHVVRRTRGFRLRRIADGVDDEEAGLSDLCRGGKTRSSMRVLDIDDAEVLAGEQRRERRVEVDRDRSSRTRPRPSNSMPASSRTLLCAPSVADEILRPDRALVAGARSS